MLIVNKKDFVMQLFYYFFIVAIILFYFYIYYNKYCNNIIIIIKKYMRKFAKYVFLNLWIEKISLLLFLFF